MRGKLSKTQRAQATTACVRIVPVLDLEDALPESVRISASTGIGGGKVVEYRRGCVCVALGPKAADFLPLDRRQKPLGDCSRVYRLTNDDTDFCRKATAAAGVH